MEKMYVGHVVNYKTRVVGIVRFSHIAPTNPKEIKEKEKELFGEDRMELRFRYFENILLPSLDAQVDKEFSILIRSSTLMPEKYKNRILSICESRKYLSAIFIPPVKEFKELELEFIDKKLMDDRPGPVATFRVDDDDGLAYDYIGKIKKYLKNSFKGFVVSFPNGYSTKEGEKGVEYYKINREMLAAGLAYIAPRMKMGRYIFNLGPGHLKLAKRYRVIIDPISMMYIVSGHEYNDSARLEKDGFYKKSDLVEVERVREKFPWIKAE